MVIDVHTHYISPEAVAAARRDPARYGVVVEEVTGAPRLTLGDAPPLRPLLEPLHNLDRYVAFMREQGITDALVGPLMDVTGYHLPVPQGRAWSRTVNDSLANDLRRRRGLHGLATVPMQDPAGAAAELRYAVDSLGFRGAMIDTNVCRRPLGDARHDPFWRTAMELAVPVILHPFVLEPVPRFEEFYLHNLVGYPFESTMAACSLIFGGTMDRMPGLSVVLVHGGGFLPYQLGRFDHGHRVRSEPRARGAGPASRYARRFYYDTLTHSIQSLCFLRDVVGADRLVLGSDFPFGLGDPQAVANVRKAVLGDADEKAALGDNAARLFRLED
jgi:aminocarboxymuconate-semialdehyde decarboxylase